MTDSITNYNIRNLKRLTKEEELFHTAKYLETNSADSLNKLVLHGLRFVHYIARKDYIGYNLPFQDLVQEGCVGFIKAINKFKPHDNSRLMTYAVYYIKDEINKYVTRNYKLMNCVTTKEKKKLFFNLARCKKKFNIPDQVNYHQARIIASELNVTADDVLEMDHRLFNSTFVSIDEAINEYNYTLDIESESFATIDPLNIILEFETLDNIKFEEAFNQLNEREKYIITRRYLIEEADTLIILSKELKVSAERIRQLEQKAIKKLKDILHK